MQLDISHWTCPFSYSALANVEEFELVLANAIIENECILCGWGIGKISVIGLCRSCQQQVPEDVLKNVRDRFYIQVSLKRKNGAIVQHEIIK